MSNAKFDSLSFDVDSCLTHNTESFSATPRQLCTLVPTPLAQAQSKYAEMSWTTMDKFYGAGNDYIQVRVASVCCTT